MIGVISLTISANDLKLMIGSDLEALFETRYKLLGATMCYNSEIDNTAVSIIV